MEDKTLDTDFQISADHTDPSARSICRPENDARDQQC